MRKGLIVFMMLLLAAPLASSFSVSYTAINNSIIPTETASFAITIINTKGFEETFQVSTRNPEWVLSTEPQLSTIPSLSTKTYLLLVKPKTNVKTGPFAVPIKVRGLRGGEFREDNLLINIKPKTPFGGEYAPSVKLDVGMKRTIDVREKVRLNIGMENKNPRDMPELKVLVESDIFVKEDSIPLTPLGTKKIEMLFEPMPQASSGIHTLTVKLVLVNITIAEVAKDFEVLAYTNTQEDEEKTSRYFKVTRDVKLTNNGNEAREAVKTLRVSLLKRIFVSFSPEPEKIKVDGKKNFEWRKTLEPGESLEIRIVENYNILVLVLIALAAAVIAYFVFRSPIVVIKEAYMEKQGKGEHSLIKVKLLVKNRTDKQIEKVTVNDRVPNMADLDSKTVLGTLKPTKVTKSSSKGTNIKWEIGFLEPYEERIIVYKMHSKLRLVGGVSLPPGKVKFKTDKQKERISYSNSVSVMEAE